jgi:hypothetical protein
LTDDNRLDRNKDGNCLSITHPNEKMLQSKIEKSGYKFAFLIFDINKVLFGDYWSLPPKFYYTNSASKEIRDNIRIDELGGSYSSVEAFRFMFKDEFIVSLSYGTRPERRKGDTPPNRTTDVQAEVVIRAIIPPDYIKKIIFYECAKNDVNDFCEQLAEKEIWSIKSKVYLCEDQNSEIDINAKLEKIKKKIEADKMKSSDPVSALNNHFKDR